MQVWNAARGSLKIQDPKNRQKVAIWAPSHNFVGLGPISSQLRHVSTIGKNLLSSNISSTCPHNMVNFGPAAEIVSLVWGTPANSNGFRVLAALLHGSLVVGVSQTLRRWTEGAAYIRQGGYHVGHWPTFLVCFVHLYLILLSLNSRRCDIHTFISNMRTTRPLTMCIK